LSNPKVTKHLVTAIGQDTYVTLPRGQIIPTFPRHLAKGESGPLVPGGGHVLVSCQVLELADKAEYPDHSNRSPPHPPVYPCRRRHDYHSRG